MESSSPILLYDGVCGLCNRTVGFILRHDARGRFRFAPLQGALAKEILARHDRDPEDLDTVYLVTDPGGPGEHLYARSRAILSVLEDLGWPWKAALILRPIPSPILDLGYRLVARVRYRWFGRSETCVIPAVEHRGRFLSL